MYLMVRLLVKVYILDGMFHRIIVYNADYSIAKQKIKEAKTIDDVKNISL